ncbi:uncharacterized protein METZ01_LOCUS246517 [marine metagenome]|uniref:Uncharacterized protein n=1 Tax=marine metagenome TaxID=408172 RepID=A0A382I496_9ZZZZ
MPVRAGYLYGGHASNTELFKIGKQLSGWDDRQKH